MGLLLILAIAGFLGAVQLDKISHWGGTLLEHFSTALFVASALGLTIDLWLKRQITEDVFKASIGYLLPEQLKEEIRWVYGFKLLCESHNQRMWVEKAGRQLVKLTVEIDRQIRNISDTPQEQGISAKIDDWGIIGLASDIVDMGYEFDNQTTTLSSVNGAKTRGTNNVSADLGKIKISPGGTVRFWLKYIEYKRENDEHFSAFSVPTVNPVYTVDLDGDLDFILRLGHRDPLQPLKVRGQFTHSGTLLPTQPVRFRWWPRT